MEPATEQTHTEPQWRIWLQKLHPAIAAALIAFIVETMFVSLRFALDYWMPTPTIGMFVAFSTGTGLLDLQGKALLKRLGELAFWMFLVVWIEDIRLIPIRICCEYLVITLAWWRGIAKSRALQLAEQLESQ